MVCMVVAEPAGRAGGQQGYGAGGGGGGGGGGGDGSFAPASYAFQYDVNDGTSGNFFGHQEQREGVNTQGTYYVQLPDSRTLRVEYTADEGGYRPVITFEGEAQFPTGSQGGGTGRPQGSYGAPPTPSQSYLSRK